MTFIDLVRKNLKFVILLPIFIAGLVLAASLFKQPLYKSSLSLLVVQQQTEDIDALAAVKSAEQMADILSRVVESRAFRASVLATDEVRVNLPSTPWKEAKKWNQYVKTKNITDTGILVVDVYQPTSAQATKLAGIIEWKLTTIGYDYLGVTSDSVLIRQLNPPLPTDNKPATPNLVLNTAVGWLFGLIVTLSLLLLFPNAFISKRRRGPSPQGKDPDYHVSQSAFTPQSEGGVMYSEKLVETINNPKPSEPESTFKNSQDGDSPNMNFVSRANDFMKQQF